MTDITDRLERLYTDNGTNYVQEAAREIRKLRAEVAGLREALTQDQIVSLAENYEERYHRWVFICVDELEQFARAVLALSAAPVVPLTDEQKQGLLHQVGIVTGANLTGMYGQRYRSLGTPYNVWEKDLFALIDAARAALGDKT